MPNGRKAIFRQPCPPWTAKLPLVEVVGDRREVEARPLGTASQIDKLAGTEFLAGERKAELGHFVPAT